MSSHGSANLLMLALPWLVYVIYVFIVFLLAQVVVIIFIGIYKKKVHKNKQVWKEIITNQITDAIFYEGTPGNFQVVNSIAPSLVENKKFRQFFIDEIIQAKKSFSGTAVSNLLLLYQHFEFYNDSHKKLRRRKWQTKARGIHELAMMGQTKYVKKLYRLNNNKNVQVRNEAQCGLVCLYGFPGLRFLNIISHPISEWQQIQLLDKLKDVPALDFDPMQKWLQSPNESVVLFSIKLAAFYKSPTLYQPVLNCLNHSSVKVKLTVLEYLKSMQEEDTCEQVIANYFAADKICRLAMLHLIRERGSQKQISFLLRQLKDADEDIKAAASMAISALHPLGKVFLQTRRSTDLTPRKTRLLQINKELVA